MTEQDASSARSLDSDPPTTSQRERDSSSTTEVVAPNMFLENIDVRQSTWHRAAFLGSVISESSLDDSQLLKVDMRRMTFARAKLDSSRFIGCSLRNVILEGCDVSGLIVNGVRIGDLFVSNSPPREEG
jgi:uncharacterized protein YjbI with pentapeptide repeats